MSLKFNKLGSQIGQVLGQGIKATLNPAQAASNVLKDKNTQRQIQQKAIELKRAVDRQKQEEERIKKEESDRQIRVLLGKEKPRNIDEAAMLRTIRENPNRDPSNVPAIGDKRWHEVSPLQVHTENALLSTGLGFRQGIQEGMQGASSLYNAAKDKMRPIVPKEAKDIVRPIMKPIEDVGSHVNNTYKQSNDDLKNFIDKANEKMTIGKAITDTASGAGNLASMLLPFMGTTGKLGKAEKAAQFGAMALPMIGQQYEQGKARGLSEEKANERASILGTIGAAINLPAYSKLFKNFNKKGGNILTDLGEAYLTGAGTTLATEGVNHAIDKTTLPKEFVPKYDAGQQMANANASGLINTLLMSPSMLGRLKPSLKDLPNRDVGKDFKDVMEDNRGFIQLPGADGESNLNSKNIEKIDPKVLENQPHISDRTFDNVSSKKVKAYQIINPETKPHIQQEASRILDELGVTKKSETIKGIEYTPEGTPVARNYQSGRETSDTINRILDDITPKPSYAEVEDALNRIVNDHGRENTALAKKVEIVIDENLSNGVKDYNTGEFIPKNDEYIRIKGEDPTRYEKEEVDDNFLADLEDFQIPEKPKAIQQPETINKIYDENTNSWKPGTEIKTAEDGRLGTIASYDPKTESYTVNFKQNDGSTTSEVLHKFELNSVEYDKAINNDPENKFKSIDAEFTNKPEGIIPEGTKIKALDRNNIGTVEAYNDQTGKYTVTFKAKDGATATVNLPKEQIEMLSRSDSNTLTLKDDQYFNDLLEEAKATEYTPKEENIKPKQNMPILDRLLLKSNITKLRTDSNGKLIANLDNYAKAAYDIFKREVAEKIPQITPRKLFNNDFYRNIEQIFKHSPETQQAIINDFDKSKLNFVNDAKRETDNLYNNVVKKLGIEKGSRESKLIQDFGEGKINEMDLKVKFPKIADKIIEADKFFRSTYDRMIDELNASRKQIYGDVLAKRKDLEAKILETKKEIAKKKTLKKDAILESKDNIKASNQEIGDKVVAKLESIAKDLKNKLAAKQAELQGKTKTNTIAYKNLESQISILKSRISQYEKRVIDTQKINKIKVDSIPKNYKSVENQIKRLEDRISKYEEQLKDENLWRGKIIPKRKDYYRHFNEMTEGFATLGNIMRTPAEIDPKLVGLSPNTKPKSKFLSLAQQRGKGEYKSDAVGGLIDYINAYSYAKNIDPQIDKFRSIAKLLRNATEETKNANSVIDYIENFANDLAGKTNPADRFFQDYYFGRKAYKATEWLNNRAKANSVLGNVGSSLSQVSNVPMGIAKIKHPMDLAKGLFDTFGNKDYSRSQFISERYSNSNFSRFDNKLIEQPKKFANWMLGAFEEPTTKFIWNSFKEQGIRKGIKDPIRFADLETRKVMAGRGIGEMPLSEKAMATKLLAPFTYEVSNSWKVMGGMVKAKDFVGLAILFSLNHLLNKGFEAVKGNAVVFDPVQAVEDATKDLDLSIEEKGLLRTSLERVGRLGGEVLSNMPFGQLAAQIYPEYGTEVAGVKIPTRKQLFGRSDPTRYGTGIPALSAIQDPVYSMLPPFGGRQAKKTIEGTQALLNGGVTDKKGNQTYQVNPSIDNIIKATLFGKSATNEAQAYFDGKLEKKNEVQEALSIKPEDRSPVDNELINLWKRTEKTGQFPTKASDTIEFENPNSLENFKIKLSDEEKAEYNKLNTEVLKGVYNDEVINSKEYQAAANDKVRLDILSKKKADVSKEINKYMKKKVLTRLKDEDPQLLEQILTSYENKKKK